VLILEDFCNARTVRSRPRPQRGGGCRRRIRGSGGESHGKHRTVAGTIAVRFERAAVQHREVRGAFTHEQIFTLLLHTAQLDVAAPERHGCTPDGDRQHDDHGDDEQRYQHGRGEQPPRHQPRRGVGRNRRHGPCILARGKQAGTEHSNSDVPAASSPTAALAFIVIGPDKPLSTCRSNRQPRSTRAPVTTRKIPAVRERRLGGALRNGVVLASEAEYTSLPTRWMLLHPLMRSHDARLRQPSRIFLRDN